MSFENYEGTAIDTSILEDVQPTAEPDQTEPVVETPVEPVTPTEPTTPEPTTVDPTEPTAPTKLTIEGLGDVTAEEIKEWKNSGLRQSDYTKKTQELAKQKEQLKEAEELYNYLKTNPHIVEAMKAAELNPQSPAFKSAPTAEREMLNQLAVEQRALKTDLQLKELHNKYGEIDELALFNKANELHTDDLEFVYKALAYDNSTTDKQLLIDEAKRQLKAELERDKNAVQTIATSKETIKQPETPTLSEDEVKVANGMGLSIDEYLKWRS